MTSGPPLASRAEQRSLDDRLFYLGAGPAALDEVGSLDAWGDGRPETDASRRTLSDVGRILASLLAREGRP